MSASAPCLLPAASYFPASSLLAAAISPGDFGFTEDDWASAESAPVE
jgi:hypothetical protein